MTNNIIDAEILATARFASPEEVAIDERELAVIRMVTQVAKLAGKQIYLIAWPNGITILVDELPSNRSAWEALIVKSYRAAITGWVGTVSVQEAI